MVISPSRRAVLALGIFATCATPALAAPSTVAPRNSYEQISIDSAPITDQTARYGNASFVSDNGLVAGSNKLTGLIAGGFAGTFTNVTRNTLTNRSTLTAGNRGTLVQTDRTNTIGLFIQTVQEAGQPLRTVTAVGRVDGTGPFRDLSTFSSGSPVSTRLSGDGRTAFITVPYGEPDAVGTFAVDIANGAKTKLTDEGIYLGEYGVSDDGRIIAGSAGEQGVVIRDGVRTVVDGQPHVSPDGSTLAIRRRSADGGPVTIEFRTGASVRTTTVPASLTDPGIVWFAVDGSRAAVGDYPSYGSRPDQRAQVVSRASGAWTLFGGPFSSAIEQGVKISRNGRFAALEANQQVVLANLEGGPLLGNLLGFEGLSASAYFELGFTQFCEYFDRTSFSPKFVTPARWVAPPRRLTSTATIDGTPAGSITSTESVLPFEPAPDERPYLDLGPTGKVATVKVTAVDGYGRSSSTTLTKPLCEPGSGGGFPGPFDQ